MTHSSQQQNNWSTRQLLAWTTTHFEKANIDAPRLAAELLFAHILSIPRINLYMDLDRPASPLERAAYKDLIERAAKHEPVQYLTSEAHFFSLAFEVNKHVLIPRPSTETLVEHIIQHIRATSGLNHPVIADVCTGSGCIAIALAKHLPNAHIVASDISPEALEVAKRNAEKHNLTDRIEFKQGHLYQPHLGTQYHFIVTNPPYIPDHEWDAILPNVKDYEPTNALRGGTDGLDLIKTLIADAHQLLQDPGQLVMEIAACQKEQVQQLASQNAQLDNIHIYADHEALPRMLVADFNTNPEQSNPSQRMEP